MPRLPQPGDDDGAWGDVLNEFLSVAHASDGSLKRGPEIDQLKTGAAKLQAGVNTITPRHRGASIVGGAKRPVELGPLFVDVRHPDFGAKGDGVADDTRAIQAAYDSLPNYTGDTIGGGTLVFPPGRYKVHALQLDRLKPAIFTSSHGRTQNGSSSLNNVADAVIIGLDHGPKTCIFKITNKRGSPNNGYGFQFRGLLLDMMAGTQYGVYAENTSFIHIDDCSAFSATSTSLPQWLACGRITDAPGFSGEDCSWWRITNCHANQVGLVTNGTAGRSGGLNQWFMGWNVCFPGNQVHACISLIGNDRPTTLSNNLEPGNAGHKVYALYLDHVGRGTFIGDSGECTVPSTFLKAMSCSGCLFAPTGYLAPASTSRLVDDDHGANIVLAPTLTAAGQNYSNSPNIHLPAGTSPRSGFSPEGLLGMEVASMPNPLSRGGWSLGYELIDVGVAGNTVKAEFLDGKDWKPWAPAALANVSYPNTDVLVIDEAHKTCRFLIGTTGDRDWPLLLCRFWANAGSPHGTIQCTVELLGADLTSVAATAHFPLLLDPGSTEGFTFPVGYTDGSYVRVTLAFPLARGQSVAFGRLALYTSSLGRTKDAPGQHFKGTGSPEGRVRGNPGDIYVNIAGGAGKTLYIKESGNSNNTGWRAV